MYTANLYQYRAGRTLLKSPDAEYSSHELMLTWNVVGLTGETGELAKHVRNKIFHRDHYVAEAAKKEMGDIWWYVAAEATKIDVTLTEIWLAGLSGISEIPLPDLGDISGNEFQIFVSEHIYSDPTWTDNEELMNCMLNLCQATGETADVIKKGVFHRHGVSTVAIQHGLSLTSVNLAHLATLLEMELEDIFKTNIDKLWNAYPEGYSSEASMSRKDRDNA